MDIKELSETPLGSMLVIEAEFLGLYNLTSPNNQPEVRIEIGTPIDKKHTYIHTGMVKGVIEKLFDFKDAVNGMCFKLNNGRNVYYVGKSLNFPDKIVVAYEETLSHLGTYDIKKLTRFPKGDLHKVDINV